MTTAKYTIKHNKETGCVEWLRCNNSGYGVIKDSPTKKYVQAHRHIWEAIYGNLKPGECVCHKCDNPKCINPEHLFIGTHDVNMKDAECKGRLFRESHKPTQYVRNRITQSDIQHMRKLNADGVGTRELAKQFHISRTSVRRVISGHR